jgi:hypothetical protein
MRRAFVLILILLFAGCELAPAMAQGIFGRTQQYQQQPPQRRHRTLLDMLFGPRDDTQTQYQPPPQQAPAVRKPRAAQLPPAKPTIAKAENATRVAVFGDSMAADIGKALDRFYADDPNVAIIQQAVGSSSFARPDYFDWSKAVAKQIAANSFDVAVVSIGINDRQTISADGESLKSLTDAWDAEYSRRLNVFLDELRAANKPVIWVGLPPMASASFSNAMSQISSLQRLAAFGSGAEFVDIYDRFLDENGNYEQSGPDVNGQQAQMRRSDGIHFATAGADKVAYYVSQSIRLFAHGGAGLAVTDPLAGSDAAAMLRPPYQGLGQAKLLQLAGAVVSLTATQPRADALVTAGSPEIAAGFDVKQMLEAPVGRADAFGAGVSPEAAAEDKAASVPAAATTPAVATTR